MQDEKGETPLHHMAMHGTDNGIMAFLLASGANPNLKI